MHKRAEIKNKIVEMLQTGFTANVYKARYLPIGKNNFPAASVYIPEDVSELAETSEHYNRTAKVIIVVYCKGYDHSEAGEDTGQSDIDTELDDLTKSIETIFFKPIQALDGVIYRMYLTKTTYMVDSKTEDIMGVAQMEFNAEYKDMII